jgi:lipoprotein-anchoring transpeptidase ErfK/SrfK
MKHRLPDSLLTVARRWRYIYLHGTGDETTLGRPATCGCTHLADRDLVPLFDRVPVGTLVWISER